MTSFASALCFFIFLESVLIITFRLLLLVIPGSGLSLQRLDHSTSKDDSHTRNIGNGQMEEQGIGEWLVHAHEQ